MTLLVVSAMLCWSFWTVSKKTVPPVVQVTPTPVIVETRREPPQTVVLEKANPHVSTDWAMGPRGMYAYYSRPVQTPAQVGILTSTDTTRQVLPLYARPSVNRSNRYQYVTKTDTLHSQDVAVVYKNKNCLSELGCEEIFDGENVSVPALGDAPFKVTMYPNS